MWPKNSRACSAKENSIFDFIFLLLVRLQDFCEEALGDGPCQLGRDHPTDALGGLTEGPGQDEVVGQAREPSYAAVELFKHKNESQKMLMAAQPDGSIRMRAFVRRVGQLPGVQLQSAPLLASVGAGPAFAVGTAGRRRLPLYSLLMACQTAYEGSIPFACSNLEAH
jgi:hypothetical protein